MKSNQLTFHPDHHLPGCMMPDGGDCCAGHAAVVEDWHKQRREIELLREQLVSAEGVIAGLNERCATRKNMKSTQAMRDRCRELSKPDQDDYDRAVICILDDLEVLLRTCGECHLKPGERCDICGKPAFS